MAPHRPPVRTGADILTCVVVLFLEGALVLVAAFTLGMRRWAEAYAPGPPSRRRRTGSPWPSSAPSRWASCCSAA